MTDVLIRTEGAAGFLSLNRPRAIHALTLPMVHAMTEALLAWRDDPAVQVVIRDPAVAAAAAVAAVVAAGLAVRAPLARVPKNTLKFIVGVMLCSFGIFWTGEGAGASWPGGDAILLALIPAMLTLSLFTVLSLRRRPVS